MTSGGNRSQQQKRYIGCLAPSQERAPSSKREKWQQTKALGIWTGTESWRTRDRLMTHFVVVHSTHGSKAQETSAYTMQPTPLPAAEEQLTRARLLAPAACQPDSFPFNNELASAQGLLILHIQWIHYKVNWKGVPPTWYQPLKGFLGSFCKLTGRQTLSNAELASLTQMIWLNLGTASCFFLTSRGIASVELLHKIEVNQANWMHSVFMAFKKKTEKGKKKVQESKK